MNHAPHSLDSAADVRLPELRSVVVVVDSVTVGDVEVEEHLELLRRRLAALTPQRRPPELDDAFATTAGGYGTLDELRADLHGRLTLAARRNQLYAARDAALRTIAASAGVQAPPDAVRQEVAWRMRLSAAERAVAGADVGPAEQELDPEPVELVEAAAERVRGRLVLDALAGAERFPVGQDQLARWVVQRARQARREPEEFFTRLTEDGAAAAVFADIRRGMAAALILDRVIVRDPAGNVLTFDDLRDAYGHDDHEHEMRDTADGHGRPE